MELNGYTTWGYDSSVAVDNFTMAVDNFTTNNTDIDHPDEFVFSWAAMVALTVIISLVSAVGLLGNAMVVFVVFYYRDMHTVINYSFANLALTDLTLLLLDAVPTAADTMETNFSASLGCSIPFYLQYVSAEVTSLTLAFLSFDRYRLIVHPLKTLQRRSPKTTLMIFIFIWLVSFVVQIPMALVAGLTDKGVCSEYIHPWGQEYFFTYSAASMYCIPLCIIIVCYIKLGRELVCTDGPTGSAKAYQRRRSVRTRSVRTVLLVTILYAVSWAPVHCVHLWLAFDPKIETNSLYVKLHVAANVLMFFNSSANPFVYTLIGPSFRSHLRTMALSAAKWLSPWHTFSRHKSESQQVLFGTPLTTRPANMVNGVEKTNSCPSATGNTREGICSSTWL